MKVPPKRKGNLIIFLLVDNLVLASMKVPPKRKGNVGTDSSNPYPASAGLNESPSEKEGKFERDVGAATENVIASMKVPPKRKGNVSSWLRNSDFQKCLNESPSEKEGK